MEYIFSRYIYSFKGDSIFTWEDFINSVQKQYPFPNDLVNRLLNTNTYVFEAFKNYGVFKVIELPVTYDYEY